MSAAPPATGFFDAFFLPEAARALDPEAARLTLRGYPPHAAGALHGHGPRPTSPALVTLERGERAATIDAERLRVERVELTTRPLAWDFARAAGSLVLHLAPADAPGERALVVAEAIAATEDDARAELAALHELLAGYCGLTEGAAGAAPARADARRAGSSRYGLRLEGDRIVLRDHESVGPKQNAGRYRALALGCLLLGLLGAGAFVARLTAGAGAASLAGVAVVPLVLFVGAFAMNEIARHASRYSAGSAPLASFGDDGVVVAPWVSRAGEVDLTPDGRLGAAIACGEIQRVDVRAREGAYAVTIDGLHGPIEVAVVDDAEVAAELQRGVEAAIARVASPKKRQTALMRAASAREQRAGA